jgi:hypothetical protein
MKLVSISYQPSANVRFTPRELRLMMACSKSSSIPGPGAFLYGWTHEPGREINVRTREVDTMMKVMEMAPHLRTEKDQQDAFGVGLKFRRIWGALSDNIVPHKTLEVSL